MGVFVRSIVFFFFFFENIKTRLEKNSDTCTMNTTMYFVWSCLRFVSVSMTTKPVILSLVYLLVYSSSPMLCFQHW